MKICWITDPHVNFLRGNWSWWEEVCKGDYDAFVLTGDLSDAKHLPEALKHFERGSAYRPVYFVLGNHDYYGSSIAEVRRKVWEHCDGNPILHYLGSGGAWLLGSKLAIAGVDGWYDGRNGHGMRSNVFLNDFRLIDELRAGLKKGAEGLYKVMQAISDEEASKLRRQIHAALGLRPEQLLLAMHVPPFAGAAWHEGKVSDGNYLPYFSSRVLGDAILEETRIFREELGGKVTVLCGHSHSPGVIHPAENLVVRTGGAEYYRPAIADVLEF